MNRREYLDTEVRKIMEKKEPNVSDLERQNELLDQWAMLQWQRAAVLQPKAGSGVPGAPTNWRLVPGFESRVPVLFLDLNDDLLTPCDDDPVGAVSTGPLFGEKEESMIDLPIIKKDEHTVRCHLLVVCNNSHILVQLHNDGLYMYIGIGPITGYVHCDFTCMIQY